MCGCYTHASLWWQTSLTPLNTLWNIASLTDWGSILKKKSLSVCRWYIHDHIFLLICSNIYISVFKIYICVHIIFCRKWQPYFVSKSIWSWEDIPGSLRNICIRVKAQSISVYILFGCSLHFFLYFLFSSISLYFDIFDSNFTL